MRRLKQYGRTGNERQWGMRPSIILIGLLVLAAHAFSDTQIARKGKATVTVVVSKGATVAEIWAAHDLVQTLSKITGAEFKLLEGIEKAPRNSIVVGQGVATSKLLPKVDWTKLGEDQTLIKKTGSILVIAGGRTRGTLNAVTRVLAKLGVRWWAPWAIQMPNIPNLKLGNVDESESPAFEYRDPYWFHAFDANWAIHNFNNGANTRIGDAQGGKIEYAGFVHTYYPLVPPSTYFGPHPEWYSLIDGKRTFEDAQLCTTNPELRDFMVEQVRKTLKANPKARIVSVSQNDCFRPCQCANCRALVAKEGSESVLVLDLANYVASKIGPDFPNVAIDTLAYQWSRHAPKSMRPLPNVIVRLCSIECNFAFPLDEKPNAAFAKDVSDWSRLTNRLYIWDYCTDFANYVEPQPDYYTFGETLKFLSEHGAKGVFEEGAYQSTGADMAELKAWVLGQLLWNPHQSDEALVTEFVNGYYGVGAKPILEYLKLMQTAAKGWNLGFASPVSASFLGYETMSQAEKLWQEAEKLAQSNSESLWRIKQAHLSVQFVYLSRWNEFVKTAKDKGDRWLVDLSRKAFADAWLKTATSPGPTGWTPMSVVNEGSYTPKQFIAQFAKD